LKIPFVFEVIEKEEIGIERQEMEAQTISE